MSNPEDYSLAKRSFLAGVECGIDLCVAALRGALKTCNWMNRGPLRGAMEGIQSQRHDTLLRAGENFDKAVAAREVRS